MQKYFQMAPAVNIYTHEHPTTPKYHDMQTSLSFRQFKTRKTWGTHALKNPIGLYVFAYFHH